LLIAIAIFLAEVVATLVAAALAGRVDTRSPAASCGG
jgi:hypothetical protein